MKFVVSCLFLLISLECVSAETPPENQDARKSAMEQDALHRAAEAGDVRQIEALLAVGAEVKVRDGYGNAPLLLAAKAGREGAAELLLKLGADPRAAAYNK